MDGSYGPDDDMAQLLLDLERCRHHWEATRDADSPGIPMYAWAAYMFSAAAGPSMPAPRGHRWRLLPDFADDYFAKAAEGVADVARGKNPRNRPPIEAGSAALKQWWHKDDEHRIRSHAQSLSAVLKVLGFCKDAAGGSVFAKFRRRIRDQNRGGLRQLARQQGLSAPAADALVELPVHEALLRLAVYDVAREWNDKRPEDMLEVPRKDLGKRAASALRRCLAVKRKGMTRVSE